MSEAGSRQPSDGAAGRGDRYTHGHHASVVAQHARRSAERDAAYLLPALQPGMRLLDVGCGPGTITTGLARVVTPGEVVGIDAEAAVLADARAHLATTALSNVQFDEASAYALPYPDASFDAAHAHQVLQHLARPVEALHEVRRVLRPGGVLGVRDGDYQTMSGWPRVPGVERWLEVYHAVASRNGADADAGRRLPSWLRAAGFEEIHITASVTLMTTPAEVQNWGQSWSRRILDSAVADSAIAYGIATREELESISAGWLEWAAHPDAFFMYVNVECVARRP